MLNTLLSIITSRLTWSFLGITAISLIIWFLGPIISVGNTTPLKSNTIRIVVILVLFLIWILIKLAPRLYRLWFNKKLENQLNINRDEKEGIKQNEQYITLAEHFSDAVKLLKKAYFSGLYNKNRPGWSNLFNRQYIYQLPWYLVIGAPNSGKTTALANSGLHFPLEDYLGKSALYGMQGMNDCNWWFTNNAVLLDTAGRYTTQDRSHGQDANEWKSFIQLLKKYRTRQPLNGLIITISVEDLLNPSAEARDRQSYILRRRLSELHERLKIRFPIYILITKTDLLKGFTAYFSHFDKTSREQIWGFNFPWSGKLGCNLNTIFEQQYSQLQQRLDAELPYILLNGHDSRECAESYLFPQEMASLRPLIEQYLEIVFAKSGFEIPCYPRGLYFTSGIQEGQPFDNVMAQFNRKFQLPTNNDSDSMSWGDDKEIVHPSPVRQAYFLKNLLENIFREAGIASYNRWWVYRKRLLNGLGYLSLLGILAVITDLFFTSYNNNKNYLMEVQDKIPAIVLQGDEVKRNPNNIYALLPILNSLAQLNKSKNFSLDNPPLSYRMGLYSGDQVSDASNSLYRKALQTLLLPQVAKLITNQMKNENEDDIEKTYNTLKAYQMLYQPEHYDGKFLHNWIMRYLETRLDANTTQKQLQQLDEHLSQLLENQAVTSPFIRDNNLLKQKQVLISKIPPAQRAYNYLKNKLLDDPDLAPVNLETLAGPQAELAFSSMFSNNFSNNLSNNLASNSGTSFANGIPGMFTPAGYQKGIDKDLNTFLTTLYSQDNWVLGPYARKLTINEIKSFVKQFYINDYIYQWDKFLADIRLNNIDSLDQRTNTARLLSAADSPLRNLVINISKNVTLHNEILNKNNAATKQLNRVVKSQTDKLTQLASKQPLVSAQQLVPKQIWPDNQKYTPEQVLEAHFSQITALAKGANEKNNQKIPFDDTLKKIGELYQYLTSVQSAVKTSMPFPPNNIITQLQATSERLPIPFRSMVYSLAVGASSDTQMSDMKNIAKHLSAEIGSFCNQAIANRYPLIAKARRDIKPDDMARIFAPETGLMDSFFQKNLVGKVDTTLQRWRFMPGVNGKPLPGGETLLRPFQQAQIIRNALFTSGTPTPLFRVMVRPISMDNNVLSMILDVDGQKLQYSHGPQLSQLISWPGPAKSNQVHMQLNLNDGTTVNLSTSGFWALNRLLDQAQRIPHGSTEDSSDDMGLQAMFNIKGHSVSLDFTPNSVFSPFRLPVFSCPNLKILTV
ncbi:type VI secretion system membrane subunit TssM [Xenorhabdus littoralis]|uniref:type VI secretion system membrane subunit TssM n=1 Tax=Xenorhabdus littoralis TaxID=2582835 RepID=UPI0029E7F72A|nr:type VI secretion system membrane subunit TssM [Xenorhabdus sp. psl]MDX7989786.1 type VI secretion system membrane subunit TssM [Xenorhabdus sp. psl]